MGRKKKRRFLKGLLGSKPVVLVIYLFIRLYSLTYRFRVENEEAWLERLRAGERILLVTWHQHFFAAIRHFRSYRAWRPGLMISRSRDGDVIAGVASMTGWRPARGSSSKGGKEALEEMVDKLKETGLAGHVVDGPRGPAGRVKAGTIKIAHLAGASVVPFYVTVSRAWVMRSWDRFFIPKPFSTVTLRFGERHELEASEDSEQFEAQRVKLEAEMRQEAGYNEEWPG